MLADQGSAASMREIARQAGVGLATVYVIGEPENITVSSVVVRPTGGD